uniref:Uncharacterized protein n=1 Tax=Siphoviridae sp. ctrpg19 TaxID=2826481 RepID=A0A8S5MKC4_9CAUD|nr:MAG TPA: hypothetical protein [Siphoviridae sp. ctrpg19]
MIWIKTERRLQKFDSVRIEESRFKVYLYVAKIFDSDKNSFSTIEFLKDNIADVMNYITEKVLAPVPNSIIDLEELNKIIEEF